MTLQVGVPIKECEFFAEDGTPITIKQWGRLMANPLRYKKFRMVNGYHLYSEWIGVDAPSIKEMSDVDFHISRWEPNDPPRIYHTFVLDPDQNLVDSVRTATKEEAYVTYAGWAEKYELED